MCTLSHLGFAVHFVVEELNLLNRTELRDERLELDVCGPPGGSRAVSDRRSRRLRRTRQGAPRQARDVHPLGRPGRIWRGCARGWTRRLRTQDATRERRAGAAHTRGTGVAQPVARQVVSSVQPALLARLCTRLLRVCPAASQSQRTRQRARSARLAAVTLAGGLARRLFRGLACKRASVRGCRSRACNRAVPSSSFRNCASSSASASQSATPAAQSAEGGSEKRLRRPTPHAPSSAILGWALHDCKVCEEPNHVLA